MQPQNNNRRENTVRQTIQKFIANAVQYFVDVFNTLFFMLRSLFLLILKTPAVLVPSVATTTGTDDDYNKEMLKKMKKTAQSLKIDESCQDIIIENWLEQISWTNSRATRERDANELIRWWQIILGVLIPALISANSTIFGISTTDMAGVAGIFVAVITAIAQFRRPEERWRHYRIVHERYKDEFWSYVTLSKEVYKPDICGVAKREEITHQNAFTIFHDRMSGIKREDVGKFFNEVIPPSLATAQAGPHSTPPVE